MKSSHEVWESVGMTSAAFDASSQFVTFKGKAGPERSLQLGYVHLGDDHPRPRAGKDYAVVPAASEVVASVQPALGPYRRLHLDVTAFYIDAMPDFFGGQNEGLLRIEISTKDPQDLAGSMFDAAVATDFRGRDQSYAPSFLHRGMFRNVLFQDWVNIRFELYEMDTDASAYYERIKQVIDAVPEVKNLDVLKGIPYLNLATKLFDGIIRSFGRNPDDHLWGELPILEVDPTPGGAFLRTGVYILTERATSGGDEVLFERTTYRDGRLVSRDRQRLPNHLIFGVSVVSHAAP